MANDDSQQERLVPESEAIAQVLPVIKEKIAEMLTVIKENYKDISQLYPFVFNLNAITTCEKAEEVCTLLEKALSIAIARKKLEIAELEIAIEAEKWLRPERDAMRKASGLDVNQAKTAVYYAVATYLLDVFDQMPMLVFLGKSGTGKSWAMEQLKKLVNNPISESGRETEAALRDKLRKNDKGYTTAFIEEGDFVSERLISDRYSKQTAKITVKNSRSQVSG